MVECEDMAVITLLMASKPMVHLSIVMDSISIMVNLNMISIIRTITLPRVTRNNLTIENHILANLNKVNTLTLTSPSMLLTVGLLSLSMASTLSPSMTITEVASLNKINILLPAILSRHTGNQSICHLPIIRRVLIQ